MTNEEQIRDVKRRHSAKIMSLPGVSGVGVAKGKDGSLVIAVHLNTDDLGVAANIPKDIEGFAVDTIHSGPFSKYAEDSAKA